MVASAHESPHRLVVAPGEIVLRDTRLVRIEARLSKSLARVLDLATGQREDVPLAALRGRTILTASIQTDQHLESSRTCSLGDEDIAVSREQILSELLDGTGDWSNRVRAITTRYSVSRRTVYRWLSRYRDGAVMSSLIPGSGELPRAPSAWTKHASGSLTNSSKSATSPARALMSKNYAA